MGAAIVVLAKARSAVPTSVSMEAESQPWQRFALSTLRSLIGRWPALRANCEPVEEARGLPPAIGFKRKLVESRVYLSK
jgi:hypothetical protein